VYDIIPYLRAGHSANYIAAVFGIGTASVKALMKYIDDHKDEVMAENRKIEERIAKGNPPEVEKLLEGSRGRALVQARLKEIEAKRAREGVNGERHPE